jgi:hypothetical protein
MNMPTVKSNGPFFSETVILAFSPSLGSRMRRSSVKGKISENKKQTFGSKGTLILVLVRKPSRRA